MQPNDTTEPSTTVSPEASAPTPEAAPSRPAPSAPDRETPDTATAREAALDDELRAAWKRANTERDDAGRFVGKDGPKPEAKLPEKAILPADKAAPKVEAKPGEVKPAETKASEIKPAAPPVVQPPNAWNAEAKAKWASVPPELQKVIADREAASHKAISDLGQYRSIAEEIRSVIEPHQSRIPQGMNAKDYIGNLFAADAALARDPVQFVKTVMSEFRLDPNMFVTDPYAEADPRMAQFESRVNALAARNEQLERELAGMKQGFQSREQTERATQEQQYQKAIAEFAADKSDWSSISTDVHQAALQLLETNPSLSFKELMEQAYERARWANPATRKALLEQQQADAERKRVEDAKAAADKAQRARAINVRGSPMPNINGASLDDELRSVWRRNHA